MTDNRIRRTIIRRADFGCIIVITIKIIMMIVVAMVFLLLL